MFHPSVKTRLFPSLVLLLVSISLAACSPASLSQAQSDPLNTTIPPLNEAANGTISESLHYRLDPALASSASVVKIEPVASTSESSYWEPAPVYRRMTLEGYAVSEHVFKPQIFVYPVEEFKSVNPAAAKEIERLQAVLASAQELQGMPFLPLVNAAHPMTARFEKLNFQNGQGIRYLTQLSQGINPINNYELIYTYQGLTGDGKYYIAAILPVTNPALPADGQLSNTAREELAKSYQGYLADTSSTIASALADSFTPDLSKLDALMSSFEIQ